MYTVYPYYYIHILDIPPPTPYVYTESMILAEFGNSVHILKYWSMLLDYSTYAVNGASIVWRIHSMEHQEATMS